MWLEAAQLLHEVRALHQRHVGKVQIAKYLVLEPANKTLGINRRDEWVASGSGAGRGRREVLFANGRQSGGDAGYSWRYALKIGHSAMEIRNKWI